MYPRFHKYVDTPIITPYFLVRNSELVDPFSVTSYYGEME